MNLKKIFMVLAALILACGTGQAQGTLLRAIGGVATQSDDSESYNSKKRYKGVSFTAPNAEGQMLSYLILPEGDNTVALVRPDKKKDRYNDASYIIPATVSYNGQTYTVTEIGREAFDNSKARSVTLPSTLKYIAAWAFTRTDLESIVLPPSVKAIGNMAFWSSKQLRSITFNEGLEVIGTTVFQSTAIESIILPKSLKKVENSAFCGTLNSVRELSVPESLTDIGEKAFCIWGGAIGGFPTYNGLITSLPSWITPGNSKTYGISPEAVERYNATRLAQAQPAQQPQVIYVQQPMAQAVPAATSARPTPSSDVDQNIPEVSATNTNTFAIIIANENYLEETPVQYALNDGQTFKTYCQKVLGLPKENIHYRENATLNMILTEVDWISKVARAYNGEANLIVYYAGHGIPDEASGSSYLLPVDGIGNNLRTGYSLAELYKTLGALPAKSVTVFMDACFSGAKRGEGMLASARGVAIKAKPEAPKGNMVVFSAAQGDETAYPYEDKGHGLFTYFLLKKLQETKGQVSLGELAQYVQQQVSRRSIVTNGKSQTPCVTPSETVVETWKGKMLK